MEASHKRSSISAMKLALEALELYQSKSSVQMFDDAVRALRQALEEKQEPVAWMYVNKDGECEQIAYGPVFDDPGVTPLYTAPPKKEWAGLTDAEIDALSQARSLTDELMDCVDRLGSEADTVDPRVWQHLLVYAPKPEEEPVAFINVEKQKLEWAKLTSWHTPTIVSLPKIPLYTALPKREWVGLTDQEIHEIDGYEEDRKMYRFARAIEAKLREKNT